MQLRVGQDLVAVLAHDPPLRALRRVELLVLLPRREGGPAVVGAGHEAVQRGARAAASAGPLPLRGGCVVVDQVRLPECGLELHGAARRLGAQAAALEWQQKGTRGMPHM